MSDTKIDLTLKDLTPSEAGVIIAYLGGDSPAMAAKAAAKPAEKKAKAKKTKAKPETKPEPEAKTEEEEDDWGDDKEDAGEDAAMYGSIKKWRELATILVANGFNTEEKLLTKCQELRGTVPALEKIPDDNLVTRCGRAIELLGA